MDATWNEFPLGLRPVWFATLGCALLCVTGAFAQVDTATIQGTIKDQTGAVIPGAKITLTNEGTSFSVSLQSTGDGSYTFTPVKIGTYTVSVEQAGFQKSSHTGITVNVQQVANVDFTLVPGQITQTVQVTGEAPLLQAQNASAR